MVGNIVAFFVVVAVVIGGAVLLFRRQKRRVAHYECSDRRLRKPGCTTGDLGSPETQPAWTAAPTGRLCGRYALTQSDSELSGDPPPCRRAGGGV